MASGSKDKTIKIWNTESGICLRSLLGRFSYVYELQQLQSGELISRSNDGTIRVWDLNKEGHCIKTLLENTNSVSSIRINNQNNFLVSYSHDGTIQLRDLNIFKCIRALNDMNGYYDKNDLIFFYICLKTPSNKVLTF